jgi:hypothetical protein
MDPDQPHGPGLRSTGLTPELMIETISCGRPGTQMPAWLKGAYIEHECYGGPLGPPPDDLIANNLLEADQIAAIVDFIFAKFVQQ